MARIIASSVRKGNILEMDGKLFVVLSAESFFPGKGTPTTQIDMRRLSDGVKTTMRYKTTEQVERAFVEDKEFSYLYQDGDNFVFMNPENEPAIKNQTASSSYKPAIMSNGVRVMVPPHIATGTRIVVQTEDNGYVERAKD